MVRRKCPPVRNATRAFPADRAPSADRISAGDRGRGRSRVRARHLLRVVGKIEGYAGWRGGTSSPAPPSRIATRVRGRRVTPEADQPRANRVSRRLPGPGARDPADAGAAIEKHIGRWLPSPTSSTPMGPTDPTIVDVVQEEVDGEHAVAFQQDDHPDAASGPPSTSTTPAGASTGPATPGAHFPVRRTPPSPGRSSPRPPSHRRRRRLRP